MVLDEFVIDRNLNVVCNDYIDLSLQINKTIDYINKYTNISINTYTADDIKIREILRFIRSVHKCIGREDSKTRLVGCGFQLTRVVRDLASYECSDIKDIDFRLKFLQRLIITTYTFNGLNEIKLRAILKLNKIKAGKEPNNMGVEQYIKSSSLKLEIITDIINEKIVLDCFKMSII